MKYLLIVAFIFLTVSQYGCYYDKQDLLVQPIPCDTTQVTYSGTVKPILASICYACHSGTAPAGNIKLDQYGPVRSVALSTNGLLLGVISHTPGYDAMPKSGGKLNDCNIQKIAIWIHAGAPNN